MSAKKIAGLFLFLLAGCSGGGSSSPTASNPAGSTPVTQSPQVNVVPPSVSYSRTNITFSKGAESITIAPTNTGGAAAAWAISPALPAGLAFSTIDGRIAGTATEVTAPADYVVTATNSSGQSQATLTISVDSGVLLELGHTSYIRTLRVTPTRALSHDNQGHWVLWDVATGDIVADGDTPADDRTRVDLWGDTLAIFTANNLEIRAASDGQILSTIPTPITQWMLARDGTYVATVNSAGLSARSPTGTQLVSRSGDYSQGVVFAAPGELRVANGGAAPYAVESITVATGVSSISPPYLGEFHSWFVDGDRLVTRLSSSFWVYSKSGVQQDFKSLTAVSEVRGSGNWFWTGAAEVYAVGASATPTATYSGNTAIVFGTKLAVAGNNRVTVVDLSGSTLSSVEYSLPVNPTVYAETGASQWLVGSSQGVLVQGSSSTTPQYFALGYVSSIAGGSARVAVSLPDRTLYFNAATKALEGSIAGGQRLLEMSADGTVLASSGVIYSLPAASLLNTFTVDRWSVREMALSDAGTTYAQVRLRQASMVREVMAVTGQSIWQHTLICCASVENITPVRLSPDGNHFAVSAQAWGLDNATTVYTNGAAVTAVPGWAVGWIDDNRLLTNTYSAEDAFNGSAIYNRSGVQVTSPALPEMRHLQRVALDSIYSRESYPQGRAAGARHAIYSVTTGQATWTSAISTEPVGAVAGPYVIYLKGPRVRAERY